MIVYSGTKERFQYDVAGNRQYQRQRLPQIAS